MTPCGGNLLETFRQRSPSRLRCLSAHKTRPAFTLLELLIALAIIVVLVGITWPSVGRYLSEQTIKTNVEQVRSTLSGVRHKSLTTGLIYQFRYEPGGQRYLVLPFEQLDPQSAGGTSNGQTATVVSAASTTSTTLPVLSGKLDERCHFASSMDATRMFAASSISAVSVTERLPEELLLLLSEGPQLAQVQWSPPVLFYPDGTADDAAFLILDEGMRTMNVQVRGLTAVVSVGSMSRGGRE